MTPLRATRATVSCVLAVAWLASASAAAQESPSYDTAIARAVQEHEAGRYAEARAYFRQAHSIAPNPRALRGIGMAAFELGDYAEAWLTLSRALTLEDATRPLTPAHRAHVEGLLGRLRPLIGLYGNIPSIAALRADGGEAVRDSEGRLVLGVGPHVVVVRLADGRETSISLDVRGGEDTTLPVDWRALMASSPHGAHAGIAIAPVAPTTPPATTAPTTTAPTTTAPTTTAPTTTAPATTAPTTTAPTTTAPATTAPTTTAPTTTAPATTAPATTAPTTTAATAPTTTTTTATTTTATTPAIVRPTAPGAARDTAALTAPAEPEPSDPAPADTEPDVRLPIRVGFGYGTYEGGSGWYGGVPIAFAFGLSFRITGGLYVGARAGLVYSSLAEGGTASSSGQWLTLDLMVTGTLRIEGTPLVFDVGLGGAGGARDGKLSRGLRRNVDLSWDGSFVAMVGSRLLFANDILSLGLELDMAFGGLAAVSGLLTFGVEVFQ